MASPPAELFCLRASFLFHVASQVTRCKSCVVDWFGCLLRRQARVPRPFNPRVVSALGRRSRPSSPRRSSGERTPSCLQRQVRGSDPDPDQVDQSTVGVTRLDMSRLKPRGMSCTKPRGACSASGTKAACVVRVVLVRRRRVADADARSALLGSPAARWVEASKPSVWTRAHSPRLLAVFHHDLYMDHRAIVCYSL